MIKNYIFVLFTLLILISCGKSKEEIELEKAKIELEKTKLELAEKTKKEEENKVKEKKAELNKIHEQKVNVGKRKKITELNLMLQKLPQAIEKAEQNIREINQFKIGRSSSTKEKQLQEAKTQLREIRDYGEKIKNEIAQLEYHKTFDFQKDPASVMKYIFESAKKGDFSNFRNLCDPYGENDSDVNQICYAEMLMEKKQADLKREFENGRVIGKAKINGDKAEVEFAFGASANRLEKMKMIKRNGLWYLGAF
ncbi:DUF4878 domain-containing protein [Winogradskyella ouciana]|uniref:DUF4878 domain-containing protein n=1 Tax=Winogradskyella ouciana TaxID=2608631 RepID=A0A7K1GGS2_9FLAO|nr:DUF4878 domain-containing protein [Winogradskyella ouciana]MTE27674.1 DUF4878 domain-containing protein [Winogradskyella ouciana]